MNSWNLILATVIIFGAGVVTGGLLVDHVNHSHARAGHHPSTVAAVTNHPAADTHVADVLKPRPAEMFRQEFLRQLDDDLQLTPIQHEAIQKIIAAGQEQTHSYYTNCTAQCRQTIQDAQQRIREQLNPDQLKQFEKLLKQQMHPPARKPATNAAPVLPTMTNAPAVLFTNAAGN